MVQRLLTPTPSRWDQGASTSPCGHALPHHLPRAPCAKRTWRQAGVKGASGQAELGEEEPGVHSTPFKSPKAHVNTPCGYKSLPFLPLVMV